MKNLIAICLVGLLTGSSAVVASIVRPINREVSPHLVNLDVQDVAVGAEVLNQTISHPYTTFLIGITASVDRGNVCTDFVGTDLIKAARPTNRATVLAKGATSPLSNACIALFVEPVKAVLTYPMDILTGGFVPAHGEFTDNVKLGNTVYKVTLNVDNLSVTVRPTRTR